MGASIATLYTPPPAILLAAHLRALPSPRLLEWPHFALKETKQINSNLDHAWAS